MPPFQGCAHVNRSHECRNNHLILTVVLSDEYMYAESVCLTYLSWEKQNKSQRAYFFSGNLRCCSLASFFCHGVTIVSWARAPINHGLFVA
jgi:hypothetical protein